MASYTVTEAKRHFSKLIDEALRGETVIITRRGRPVIEMRPVSKGKDCSGQANLRSPAERG